MAAKSKHAKLVTDNAYIDVVSPIFSNERWISIPSRSPDFVPVIVRTNGTREREEDVKKKKTRTENKRKKRKREKESFCSKYKRNMRCVFESLVVFERTFTRIPCNRCVGSRNIGGMTIFLSKNHPNGFLFWWMRLFCDGRGKNLSFLRISLHNYTTEHYDKNTWYVVYQIYQILRHLTYRSFVT